VEEECWDGDGAASHCSTLGRLLGSVVVADHMQLWASDHGLCRRHLNVANRPVVQWST